MPALPPAPDSPLLSRVFGSVPLGRAGLVAVATLLLTLLASPATGGGGPLLAAALGLAVGLGVAGQAREGAGMAWAATVPLALALPLVGLGATTAAAVAVIALLASLALGQVLRRAAFDWRLERARDLVGLLLAALVLGALVIGVTPGLLTLAADAGLAHEPVAEGLLALTGFLLAALPACTVAPLERRPGPGRALLLGVLALLVVASAAAPWHATQGDPRAAWWFAPFVALLALSALGGTACASLATLAASLAIGIASQGGGVDLQAQSLAMVVAMQALLLVSHALRAEGAWREQRWQWALDGSRLGVADWQLRDRDSFVSAAWRSLSGFEGPLWSPAAWVDAVHPEDRQELRQALAQVSSGSAGRLRLELRMPVSETWRWLEATLLVIERDADGTPVRLLATLLDVDERHDAQERQRLSASLFQHLHEGLLITDNELRVLDANPAYTQILGVPRAELLGTVPSLLRPAPDDPQARQQRAAMWAGLRDNGGWRGELLERRRSGEMSTLQVTISSVNGPQDDLRYHVLVITDVTEQRMQRERLERQAHFDELTRLPNRARLSQLLAEGMLAAQRDGYLLVVCYLDLDLFKQVNDRHGHAAGDRLLVELAGRLRSALRMRDAWSDTAARLGGDEFVLLLRAETLPEGRMAVQRVLRVVAQPYAVVPGEEPVQVTASIGATIYPLDPSDADTLLRHADHAMYGAKQEGRNRFFIFDDEHRKAAVKRATKISEIQDGMDRAEFSLYYQPKVDMRAGRVLGFEALLRWDHPVDGLLAPMQFLPDIENTALSSRLGYWVFTQAMEHLAQWRRSGLDISVSVNVSPRHLQEFDFAQRLEDLLSRRPEPLAPYFEIELLETAAHEDIDATSKLLARCRALGVRFALDDFGTGYSTLTYLKRLPVDVLKIDRSFVHHMLDDSQDRAIVEGVIGLARTFGCVVVAEGVESPAQARTLLDMGCDIGQGMGIASPMPAGQVAAWARQYRGMFALSPAAGKDSPADSSAAGLP